MLRGQQAEQSWSHDRCCAGSGNICKGSSCFLTKASNDFVFGLAPGTPVRFTPTGGDHHYHYQTAAPDSWPSWGAAGDLDVGSGGTPGRLARCDGGGTYAGRPGQICGGEYNWGPGRWGADGTELEVWHPRDDGV